MDSIKSGKLVLSIVGYITFVDAYNHQHFIQLDYFYNADVNSIQEVQKYNYNDAN